MKKIGFKIALLLCLLAVTVALVKPHIFEQSQVPPASRMLTVSSGSTASSSLPGSQVTGLQTSSAGDRASSAVPSGQVPDSQKAGSASSAVSRSGTVSSGNSVIPESSPPRTAPSKSSASAAGAAVSALMPEASGTSVFSEQGAAIDYSNASQGYIMVRYSGSAKIKVLVYYNGGSSYYQYNLSGNGVYQTLPLQSGSGSYRVRFMQNLYGSTYAELCSTTVKASVGGSGCYVYPNQYVNYSRSSAAVTKAKSLCAGCGTNSQKAAAIYHYIITTVRYDYSKASSVTSGYLPNVDETLQSRKGICFDYAALMAAMCRSQRIPTRLVIGNTSYGYHAWNEVYLNGWVRYDPTFAAAGQTAGTYTPQKYY